MRILALAFVPVLITSLSAQSWFAAIPANAPGSPAGRSWPGFVHDGNAGLSLLFGGYTAAGDLQDTWVYSGASNTWTQLQPANAPAARDSAAMAFDPLRNVVVMFGGSGWAVVPYADTWEWNGVTWTQRTPVGSSPVGRLDAAMTFFPVHGKVFLHGGVDHSLNRAYADSWEWDGTSWTQVGAVPQPYMRSGHAIAYDAARARIVLFGGMTITRAFPNDTWEYDGTSWVTTSTSGPTPRRWAAMAYDPTLGGVVLHGGGQLLARYDDTWLYNGSWTQLSPATTPGARDSHRMVYDAGMQQLVMFGGYNGVDLDDTWWFGGAPQARYSYFGQGCAGSNGVPMLQAQGTPSLGTQFQVAVLNLPSTGGAALMALALSNTSWNGVPLPLSLATLGLPGCTALCSFDHRALLLHNSGTATWNLAIPNTPVLSGLRFYNQALSLDPLAGNALGAAMSNGGDGTLR